MEQRIPVGDEEDDQKKEAPSQYPRAGSGGGRVDLDGMVEGVKETFKNSADLGDPSSASGSGSGVGAAAHNPWAGLHLKLNDDGESVQRSSHIQARAPPKHKKPIGLALRICTEDSVVSPPLAALQQRSSQAAVQERASKVARQQHPSQAAESHAADGEDGQSDNHNNGKPRARRRRSDRSSGSASRSPVPSSDLVGALDDAMALASSAQPISQDAVSCPTDRAQAPVPALMMDKPPRRRKRSDAKRQSGRSPVPRAELLDEDEGTDDSKGNGHYPGLAHS